MTAAANPSWNPTMNQSPSGSTHQIEMSLREHLLAAGAGQPPPQPQQITPSPQAHAPDAHAHQGLDPSITSAGYPMSAGEGGDGHLSEGGRKGRRELSTSKRAAQNRAAQRAFRQRKEEYIKSLKDQVKEFEQMADQYRSIQAENHTLREYVINLQARLIESQGSYPDPPSDIDLTRPHNELPAQLQNNQSQPPQYARPQHSQQHPMTAPNAPMTSTAAQQLQQAAAQAAAAHATTEQLNNGAKHAHDEAQYLPAAEYPAAKRQKSDDTSAGAGIASVNSAGMADSFSTSRSPFAPYACRPSPGTASMFGSFSVGNSPIASGSSFASDIDNPTAATSIAHLSSTSSSPYSVDNYDYYPMSPTPTFTSQYDTRSTYTSLSQHLQLPKDPQLQRRLPQ